MGKQEIGSVSEEKELAVVTEEKSGIVIPEGTSLVDVMAVYNKARGLRDDCNPGMPLVVKKRPRKWNRLIQGDSAHLNCRA